ncbi:PA0069 family radical SAM protein [Planctomycetota bacterium]|nr:PA0069 family radical SAM protein [Planctomycetota bacterium]
MDPLGHKIHGRGTGLNPVNRFEKVHVEYDAHVLDPVADSDLGADITPPKTQFFDDTTKSIISWNDSPDIPFNAAINPYRGCEHGCVYCFARQYHEYLGYSSGLDFETKIHIKRNAAELLRREFMKKSWKPQPISLSGATDVYQPVELKLRITRSILEVLAEFRNPVGIITKNALVTRDMDRLLKLSEHNACRVMVSITTIDDNIRSKMEPRTSTIDKRFEAVARLREAGIPVGVMLAPIIPGLTCQDIPKLVERAAGAGADSVHMMPVRLPYAVSELFDNWLQEHFPMRRKKVLNRLAEMRGQTLDDSRVYKRMTGEGKWAEELNALFQLSRRKHGLDNRDRTPLNADAFRRPGETKSMF